MAFTPRPINKTTFNQKNQPLQKEQHKVTCQVNRFLYEDEVSGFFVFLGQIPEGHPNPNATVDGKPFAGRKFAVVGNSLLMVQTVVEGQEVEVTGYFEPGKQAGSIQLTATAIQEKIPTKPKAIEIFLGSGKIYGIGPKTAKKIVGHLGSQTIEILDKEPDRLLEVEGINLKKLQIIKQSWTEWRSVYEIISTMQLYEVGDVAGVKIFNHFKEKSIWVIKNDPYALTDVPSIGFKTADKIAQSSGVSPVDEKRIEKCILYTLEEIGEKGHTAFPIDELIHKVNETLMINVELIEAKVQDLIQEDKLISKPIKKKVFESKFKDNFSIVKKEGVAHKKIHNTEARIAKELKRLMDNPSIEAVSASSINYFLDKNDDKLDDSQLEAARIILSNKVSILTGGPGTGKTHTIKSLLRYFDSIGQDAHYVEGDENGYHLNSVLSAPTGRAAKRMEESTGKAGSTMHRLLGYKEGQFVHNENNKLKGDVFFIDESSMIDIWLQNGFLKSLPGTARVIFVGDVDQLPSVGAGNVLRDMIDSKCIPVARLSVIHRQALNSNIIVASHSIIHKKVPPLYDISSDSDFVFVEKEGNEEIHDTMTDIISTMVSKGINPDDIQILTPKKETEVGTHSLNNTMRGVLNPRFLNYQDLQTKFVPGDRVMQYKNDRELDIFNGDIGVVAAVDEENGIIKVRFDEKQLEISGQELANLNLSYAITIHKSQGSDYPYVIIPISKSHTFMWDANLLYTAVTRGKKRVILVGEKKTLVFSVANFKQNDRITGLKDEIRACFEMKIDEDETPVNLPQPVMSVESKPRKLSFNPK